MMLQFLCGILFTKHIVGDNRGNIVNHPMWKRRLTNSLDGLLLSFVLYFYMGTVAGPNIYCRAVGGDIWAVSDGGGCRVAANYLLNRREQKRCSVGFTFNLTGSFQRKAIPGIHLSWSISSAPWSAFLKRCLSSG